MRKRFILAIGMLAIFAGCGQQPELDVNADQNKTEQNKTEQNNTTNLPETIETNNSSSLETDVTDAKLVETDLTDTTNVKVDEENKEEPILNQNLAKLVAGEVVHFDFDKYNIRPDQVKFVEAEANIIKDAKNNFTVRIEGNCDEWGSDEYNYALGLKRAKTVKEALINLGVDSNKLTIISYGESNPVCTAHNRECWAKNRRDNFTLLP